MVNLRSQEDDPVPQWFSRIQEAYDQRFLRIQEATEQRFSRLEAMVADYCASMKQTNQTNQTGGSDHFEGLRGDRRTEENPEDQALNDEELFETKASGIEDRAVENGANSKVISAIVKEESIPQSKVPIEPGKVDLGLEKLEYVVLNENLEQEWDQQDVKEKTDVDGDVERDQKLISDTKTVCAHQLFDQMPGRSSRANRVWKPGGLLCVQDHSGGNMLMITQPFHGLHLQRIIYMDMKFQEVLIDDVLSGMDCLSVPNKKFKAELEIYGCETKKHLLLLMKLANRVWESGELLATHVYCKWLENCYKHKWRSRLSQSFSEMKQRMIRSVWKFFGYLMEAHGSKYKRLGCVVEKTKLRNVEDEIEPVTNKEMLVTPQIAVNANLEFSDYNNKRMKGKTELLATSQKMQKMDFFSFGIHTMMEEDQKQQGDSELLVIVLECVDAKGGVGMDKKPFHLSLRNHRVWDPGGCISGLSRSC